MVVLDRLIELAAHLLGERQAGLSTNCTRIELESTAIQFGGPRKVPVARRRHAASQPTTRARHGCVSLTRSLEERRNVLEFALAVRLVGRDLGPEFGDSTSHRYTAAARHDLKGFIKVGGCALETMPCESVSERESRRTAVRHYETYFPVARSATPSSLYTNGSNGHNARACSKYDLASWIWSRAINSEPKHRIGVWQLKDSGVNK